MNQGLEKQRSELYRRHRRKRRWRNVVSVLAAVTVFATTYALILPAITLERPSCGQEEHAHDESCYEERSCLSCGLEEDPGHTHDESCYAEDGSLLCGQEERPGHTHTEACYTTEPVLACGREEHVHSGSCCPAVSGPEAAQATGEEEESEPEEPSGDPTADLESSAQWESTFAHLPLTGDWAKDVLSIADTQLGYTESARNFITDDGRAKGYTRYGAWYGSPYGDWCAMFVSFCQHYAGVDSSLMPMDANCQNWIETLSKEEWKRYRPAHGEYTPEPGDLIFFDWEEDGISDHVGLVYELIGDEDGTPVQVKTIEGNSSDRVQYVQYALTDSGIMGYAELPENPEKAKEETENTETQNEQTEEETEASGAVDSASAGSPKEEAPAVLTATAENGVTVSMTAPKASLPFAAEELSLAVSVIDDKEAKELIETEASEDDGKDVRRKSVLFDIRLLHEGEEVEPKGPVSVSFAGIETPKDDARVFHVDPEENKAEEMALTEPSAASDGTITVDTDHFSIYGVTYTVDFHYGDYTFSILGKSEILLSELFANLNMDRSAADVTKAEFSDPELVAVEQVTNDWKLTSLKAFNTEETLTITFADGTELVIGVTDAPANGVGENYVPNTAEVTALNISKVTGTAPWDTDNNPGNDKDATNDIVRSFDTVFYNVGYTLNLIDKYNGLFSGYKKANLYVKVTLPLTKEQAGFDLSGLSWMSDVQVQDNGSSQTLTGYYAMEAVDFDYIVPGTGTLRFPVFVKGMANGTTVIPVFELWLDDGDNTNHTATAAEKVTPTETHVSSKAGYNVKIKKAADGFKKLDPASGTINNSSNYSYLAEFAVFVESYNTNTEKGRKGLYIDAEDISFTLTGSGAGGIKLWDYSLIQNNASVTGALGRQMNLVYGKDNMELGKELAPYSDRSQGDADNSAYNSGALNVSQSGSTITVSFNDIAFDLDSFPTRAAVADASGTQLMLSKNESVLATAMVQVYYPLPSNVTNPAYYTQTYTAQAGNNLIIDETGYPDQVPTDHTYTFTTGAISGGNSGSYMTISHNGIWKHNQNVIQREDSFVAELSLAQYDNLDYGSDHYVLFNGNIFEPDFDAASSIAVLRSFPGKPDYTADFMVRCYFLAYPDGRDLSWSKANWPSINEAITQFRKYTSLSALYAALGQDAKCVGLYVECRTDKPIYGYIENGAQHIIRFPMKIKEDAPQDIYGHMRYSQRLYIDPTILNSNWTFANYSSYANLPWAAYAAYNYRDAVQVGYDVYKTRSSYTDFWYSSDTTVDANGNWTVPFVQRRTLTATSLGSWQDSGYKYPIETASFYIVPEKAQIDIHVAQKDTGGKDRTVFMPERGERSADYELSPRMIAGGSSTSPHYTAATITNILPKGLSYVPGSCYLGGTYNQPPDPKTSGTVTGGVLLTDNGTVSGVSTSAATTGDVTMSVVENGDGTTTLSWTLTNVQVNQDMPKIYYSTHIGDENDLLNDVTDGQQLTNTAQITSSGSSVAISVANGNLDSATVTVQKFGSSTLIKHVSASEVDVDEDITYTLDYVNNTAQTLAAMNILDLLPYNGDLRGSVIHGSYTVDTVTVERLNDAAGHYTLGYTTDTAVQGHENDLFSLSPVYSAATATVAGKVTTLKLPANTSPTLLNIKGTNVGGYAKIRITVTLHPTGNKDGDSYGNDAAYNTPTIPAPVYAAPVYATVVQQRATLTIKKTLIGGGNISFPFEVLFTDANGDPVKIPEDTANPKRYEVDAASPYKVTFRLFGGNSVKLSGIPVGTTATITETNHDGYTVLIKDTTAGGTTLSHTETAAVTVTRDQEVEVINNPGVVLPSAGGPGNSLYIGSGAALLLFTFLLGFRLRRRRERRAKR